MKNQLALITQPQDYFRELVTDALSKQKVRVHPDTEYYLVNLLNHFISTDSLYARDHEGNHRDEPLALLFKQAIEERQRESQKLLFQHIGDVSLYTAGFFQESLNRKIVDVDYYIGMGGNAYQQAESRANVSFRTVFQELSSRFKTFVDVLSQVSEKTTPKATETDILRVYDLYVKTKSEKAKRALHEVGIVPPLPKKTDIQ